MEVSAGIDFLLRWAGTRMRTGEFAEFAWRRPNIYVGPPISVV
jgi:hypothetical protein